MTKAGAPERERRSVRQKIADWLSKVFELNPAGLNWPRAVMILDVVLVPLVVFWAIGHEEYLLSAVFGVLFAALADPGGGYWQRAFRIFVFGAIGAGLTALAFGIGGDAWGWLVLATFVVTLASGEPSHLRKARSLGRSDDTSGATSRVAARLPMGDNHLPCAAKPSG